MTDQINMNSENTLKRLDVSEHFAFIMSEANVCEETPKEYRKAVQENAEMLFEYHPMMSREQVENLLATWRNKMPVGAEDGTNSIMRIPSRIWYSYMAGVTDSYMELQEKSKLVETCVERVEQANKN